VCLLGQPPQLRRMHGVQGDIDAERILAHT
jgi:hypothetical protein